jgi:hypothetical protein
MIVQSMKQSHMLGKSRGDFADSTRRPNVPRVSQSRACLTVPSIQGSQTDSWTDAICINPQDLAEKSHQMMMMREIYTGSEQVLA